jgi:hypothetical protein
MPAAAGALTANTKRNRTAAYRRVVRHATPRALDELEPLLARVRELDGLIEKKRGVFYLRSKAFLHFHEDPSGLHADVRLSSDFERFRVDTPARQDDLISAIKHAIGSPPT